MAKFVVRSLCSQLMLAKQCFNLKNLRICHCSSKSDALHSFWDEEGSIAVQQSDNSNPNVTASVKSVKSKQPKVRDHFSVQTESTEIWRPTSFGYVRFDNENLPTEQPEEETENNSSDNFIDQYFFGDTLNEKPNNVKIKEDVDLNAVDVPIDTNEIDQQYFYKSQEEEDKGTSSVSASELKFEENEIDEQYFGKTYRKEEMSAFEYLKRYKHQLGEDIKTGKLEAYNKKEEEGDGIVKKSYKTLVPDLTYLPNDILVSILKKSILHHQNGIIAINKPYGLVTTDKDRNSKLVLTDILPLLSEKLKVEKLYTVHRLDRYTSGILLLAYNQEMAKKLTGMFQQQLIKKKYLTITKRIPDPKEGTIDIPVGECTLLDRQRMKLRPVRPHSDPTSAKYNARVKSSKAVTHFQVIKSRGSAALVELEPETGVRHQLRVHLSQALGCPILGDHKYSHDDRYAPQKLPDDMLVRLGLTQAQVRQVPMHLHAMNVHLPGLGEEGNDLSITAPLPPFFRYTLKKLKITSKKE